MKRSRRDVLNLAASAIILPALPRIARAQAYPARPVRMIVPFGPGGPTDVCARIVAQKLSEQLGRQFFVENVPGASSNIGTGQAARAAPDGHTLLVTVNNLVINPTLFGNVPFDPFKSFEPIILAAGFASALVVHPSMPVRTVAELVAHIKANPAKYSFASAGIGTPSHLLGEQFRLAVRLDLVNVPYGGSGPATASVVAGHSPIGFVAVASAAPHVQENTLRALAVMSKTRSQAMPQVPTIAEAGHPGLDGDAWVGVLVPAGAPKDIVALLHREIAKMLALPEMKERLAMLGLEPLGGTPEEFATQIRFETEKWSKVIRAANLKAE